MCHKKDLTNHDQLFENNHKAHTNQEVKQEGKPVNYFKMPKPPKKFNDQQYAAEIEKYDPVNVSNKLQAKTRLTIP